MTETVGGYPAGSKPVEEIAPPPAAVMAEVVPGDDAIILDSAPEGFVPIGDTTLVSGGLAVEPVVCPTNFGPRAGLLFKFFDPDGNPYPPVLLVQEDVPMERQAQRIKKAAETAVVTTQRARRNERAVAEKAEAAEAHRGHESFVKGCKGCAIDAVMAEP